MFLYIYDFIECIGFYGVHCGRPCVKGFFGEGCRSYCNCTAEQTCNQFVGCITPGNMISEKLLKYLLFLLSVMIQFFRFKLVQTKVQSLLKEKIITKLQKFVAEIYKRIFFFRTNWSISNKLCTTNL